MEIIRKYHKMPCSKLIHLIELEINHGKMEKEDFYLFMDELTMRKLESISEGEIFKIRKCSRELLNHLKERHHSGSLLIEEENVSELERLALKI